MKVTTENAEPTKAAATTGAAVAEGSVKPRRGGAKRRHGEVATGRRAKPVGAAGAGRSNRARAASGTAPPARLTLSVERLRRPRMLSKQLNPPAQAVDQLTVGERRLHLQRSQ